MAIQVLLQIKLLVKSVYILSSPETFHYRTNNVISFERDVKNFSKWNPNCFHAIPELLFQVKSRAKIRTLSSSFKENESITARRVKLSITALLVREMWFPLLHVFLGYSYLRDWNITKKKKELSFFLKPERFQRTSNTKENVSLKREASFGYCSVM